jgi:hypothetical protein
MDPVPDFFIWITLVSSSLRSMIYGFSLSETSTWERRKVTEPDREFLVLICWLSVSDGDGVEVRPFKEGLATLIFIPLVGVAIWAGQLLPLDLGIATRSWRRSLGGIILAYCLVASQVSDVVGASARGALGGWFLYIALAVCASACIRRLRHPISGVHGLQADSQLEFLVAMFPVLSLRSTAAPARGSIR